MKHTILHTAEGYHCTVCQRRWRGQPDSASGCTGLPTYAYDRWPKGMLTEKQMKAKRLIPGPLAGLITYSKAADGSGYLKVYRESEATPKPAPSEKQIAAQAKRKAAIEARWMCPNCGYRMESMREYRIGVCVRCQEEATREYDRHDAAREAYEILLDPNLVVFDSETTDLDGRFVEIGVVDRYGHILLDQRIRPQCLISQGAYEVHGIRDEDLATMPTFINIYPELRRVLHGKTWLIYNESFDRGILGNMRSYYGEYKHYFRQYPIEPADSHCMMLLYAQWYGDWHGYYKSYRWQKLEHAASGFGITTPRAAHSAIGDCLATLDLLYKLAEWYRNEVL